MTYDEAKAEVLRLETALLEAKQKAQQIRDKDPRQAVGKYFRVSFARALVPALVSDATYLSKWLAQKCINEGPGAAHDSGEAKIVVILDELCERLKERGA